MKGSDIALVALMLGLGTQPAISDPRTEAKAHLDQGLRHYNTGDYKAAIAAWRKAYVLVPQADTLFAIGQAQRLDGDCKTALASYRAVLREQVPAKQAAEVRIVIEVCEKTLREAPPEPVVAPIDPQPTPVETPNETPIVTPIETPQAAPSPVESSPRDRRRAWYTDKLGGGLVGVGVLGVAAGATFLVLGSAAESDADSAPDYMAFDRAATTARRDHTIGVVGLAAGGALILGGVVRYLTRSDEVEVAASVAATGGSLTIAGTF